MNYIENVYICLVAPLLIAILCFNAKERRNLLHLLIRGFGTGTMHVVCGVILAIGMGMLWEKLWLRVAGTAGLLAVASTYHGVYIILVSQTGWVAWAGYLIPVVTAFLISAFGRKLLRMEN